MRKTLVRGLAYLCAALLSLGLVASWLLFNQEIPASFWKQYGKAQVVFDDDGIPTIAGGNWDEVIEAQGFVVASQRMWQMDLLRRRAAGRLAEWFGARAVDADIRAQSEDRRGVVERAAQTLPAAEKASCEAYARGVNAFIERRAWQWGAEYLLLREKPELWSCADTLLVVLLLSDMLTTTYDADAIETAWAQHLNPTWHEVLFPTSHPWNKPLFGKSDAPLGPLPQAEWLPRQAISAEEAKATELAQSPYYRDEVPAIGSNSWAVRSANSFFLANDPHLGQSVPGIWFAQRLRVSAESWEVGVSVPGLPGVVLGMSRRYAWAFTNTGEDVDDLLREEISSDGARYLVRRDSSGEEWAPIVVRTLNIQVRGESKPRIVHAQATHRGPLARRRFLDNGLYSRQWLPLKDGVLRIPTLALLHAESMEQIHAAIDGMRTPSQNIIIADRQGSIVYRASGTGVTRQVTGLVAQAATEGEWSELAPPNERPRLSIGASNPAMIVTANERIWTDTYGNRWRADDRKERLVRELATSEDWTQADMERLQLDTQSRFRKELLNFMARHLDADGRTQHAQRFKRWEQFDGDSRHDPLSFAEAGSVESGLLRLLAARVQRRFFRPDEPVVPLVSYLRRAILLRAMDEHGPGFATFGLEAADVARFVFERAENLSSDQLPQHKMNLWRGRHPFASLPVLGTLFEVPTNEQWGAADVPLAETPSHGPSVRLVWNLRRPQESTWSLPIGQSGHIGSKHFRDWRERWLAGRSVRVFGDEETRAGAPFAF